MIAFEPSELEGSRTFLTRADRLPFFDQVFLSPMEDTMKLFTHPQPKEKSIMKAAKTLLPVLAIGTLATSGNAATITEVGGFPGGALISNPSDFTSSTRVSSTATKGQTFSLASETDITAFTFQLEGEAGDAWDADGSLTLSIYNLDGGGLPTGAALFSESGTLPGTIDAPEGYNDFLTITPGSTWNLAAGSYGLAISTSDADLRFELTTEDAYSAGNLITNTGSWAANTSGTDLAFAIEGNVVPEPGSLALIGLGGLCLIKRRRRGA